MLQRIATIAWKDTLLRFSSRSEILFFLVLPIVFTVLLSGGLGGSDDGDPRIPVLLADEDGGTLAAALREELQNSATVALTELSPPEAEAAFAEGAADLLLTIPAGFTTTVSAGGSVTLGARTSAGNPDAAPALQAVRAAVAKVSGPPTAARAAVDAVENNRLFSTRAEQEATFARSLTAAQTIFDAQDERIVVTRPAAALVDSSSGYGRAAHQSIGQLVTWVFIPLLATSGFLALERQQGTLRRLMVTPTDKRTFLLGVISGQLSLGLVQMALLIGFGIIVMGVNWGQSPAGLALLLFSFGLASVAFGVTLGTYVRTPGQAGNVSIMFGMSMALLGGAWFPMELFPPAVQTAVHVLPTTWAMEGLTDLVIRGQGVAEVLPEAGVLFAFAALFFVVGVRRFRYE